MESPYLVALKYQAMDMSDFLPSYSIACVKIFFAPVRRTETKYCVVQLATTAQLYINIVT